MGVKVPVRARAEREMKAEAQRETEREEGGGRAKRERASGARCICLRLDKIASCFCMEGLGYGRSSSKEVRWRNSEVRGCARVLEAARRHLQRIRVKITSFYNIAR